MYVYERDRSIIVQGPHFLCETSNAPVVKSVLSHGIQAYEICCNIWRLLIGNRWRMWSLIIVLSLSDVSTVLSLEDARVAHSCSSSIYRKFLLQFCPLNLYTVFMENFLDTQSISYLPNPIEVVEWKREHVFLLSFEHVPVSQITDSIVKYSTVHSPMDLVMQLL